ncbi:piggyBac transposable element-derived protein 4-like [Sander lucioperca]|uniref:piggyBac transposable element-derived protein 4-like n=1 Tax=Sander lucioperca TaxID=283035 RepID=UPI00125E8987|nr:piggyBac transposable element-derived protein 4-like [Sander lucioperca]
MARCVTLNLELHRVIAHVAQEDRDKHDDGERDRHDADEHDHDHDHDHDAGEDEGDENREGEDDDDADDDDDDDGEQDDERGEEQGANVAQAGGWQRGDEDREGDGGDDDGEQDEERGEERGANAPQEGGRQRGDDDNEGHDDEEQDVEQDDEDEEDEEEEESERFASRDGEIEWSSTTYHPHRPGPRRRRRAEYEEDEEQQLDDGDDGNDQDQDQDQDQRDRDQDERHDQDERQQQDPARRATAPQSPGPTEYAATRVRDILSAFELFVTRHIQEIVVTATNIEGLRKCGNGWKLMDATDLRGYIGLLLLAGVYRSRNEALESLWHEESGRAIFRATMPLKRFHAFSRLLRFDDRETRAARRAADKLAAIRDVWDAWVRRLPRLYNPGPDVTVDEQLVPFRGRCSFRQYMPSKPARYGLKSWVACDAASSYAWNMQMYTGKSASGGPERNLGARVVLDVTKGLRGPRNVTCDNFFTSYELARRLLIERRLTVVGTMRKNKPELPRALLNTKGRALFSSRFAFTPTVTLVSYVPKRHKNVLLLSTLHTGKARVRATRDAKPDIILHYNSTKGGVDNLDKLVGTYSCRRKTTRWPLAVFHNILDVSAYNAFVLWRELRPQWMRGKLYRRRVFLEQLGRALVTPLIERRSRLPRTEASAALVKALTSRAAAAREHREGVDDDDNDDDVEPTAPRVASKRKRCQLCPKTKDRKTYTACGACKRYICGRCTRLNCAECVRGL